VCVLLVLYVETSSKGSKQSARLTCLHVDLSGTTGSGSSWWWTGGCGFYLSVYV
jgi:hypothetical protein